MKDAHIKIDSLRCCIAFSDATPNVNCRKDEKGLDYLGTLAVTETGRKCQLWTSQYPHAHNKVDIYRWFFPDGSIARAKNYCRNPDWSSRPWCYTMDPKKKWEYCNVDICPEGIQNISGKPINF